LKTNYLVRGAWCAALFALACGGRTKPQTPPAPAPTIPLPTAGLAGQSVSLFPLTLVAAEDVLHWDTVVADRRTTLTRADSILAALLQARAPEVGWVLPDELRRASRRSAGLAADPDRLGTAILRNEQVIDIPDPLRAQLRTLAALGGGRFAVMPAALVYKRATATATPPEGIATAELSVALVDVRLARVVWRTVARGDGDDPWTALTRAVKALTPGLP
jgi:hypothetical protein